MKNNHLNRFAGSLTTAATILALSSAAQAQALYWDTNGPTAGFGTNFAGSWNGAAANWNADATGGAVGGLTAITTSSNALIIAGGAATGSITLSPSQTAGSIDFANTANLAVITVNNGADLTVTGAITDSGAGTGEIRVLNTTEASAASKLTASSITIGNLDLGNGATAGQSHFLTTGYNGTVAGNFYVGNAIGNATYTQTAGAIILNNSGAGLNLGAVNNDATNAPLSTATYIMDGGTLKTNRIGVGDTGGNNFRQSRFATNGAYVFNSGTIQNLATNSTLNFQNAFTMVSSAGGNEFVAGKDMQYNTSKPLTVQLAQSGTHTLDTDGATGLIIVTPSAQFVNKLSEAGTLNKTGLGNLVFTGGGPVAVNSYTGATTVTAGKVMTDYRIVGGQAATGGTDSLTNGYSAASQLVLNGGNYELVGRSSASASDLTGITLTRTVLVINVTSSAGLVVGQSVTNSNLPADTYIRRIISPTQIELSAFGSFTGGAGGDTVTGQTLNLGAATFDNTQTINSVDLLQDATVTVTPGAGTSTTLLSFGDVAGSGKLTKAGTGVLKLTGTISHTGSTAINAGTLEFASASDQTIIAPVTGSGTFVKSGSGILTMDAIPASRHSFTGAVIVNGGTLTNVGNAEGLFQATSFTVNDGGILLTLGDGVGFGGMGALTVNAGGTFGGGVQQISSLTLNGGLMNGTGSFSGVNFALNQDVTVGGSSASTIQGNAGIALSGNTAAAGVTRTFDVADATGDDDADLTISTVVRNSYVNNRLANLTKTGAGTLRLSAANTYTGETIVLDGTLAVNGISINNANKLTIDGGMVDLTNEETVSSLFFGAVQQAPGIWGSSSSVAVPPFVDDTRFSGTGTLNVVPAPVSSYAGWQSANSTSQAANLDHDNDGISNGVEHFLGGIGNTTGNSNPLPSVVNTAGTLSVTWVRNSGFSGFPGNYGTAFLVETSATLASPWTPAAQGGGAGFVEITGDSVKYTFPAGTKNFARLKVVTP